MKTLGLTIIKILRGLVSFGLFIAGMFFLNHVGGFLFGIGFKSVGKVTLELLGGEILIMAGLGGAYWVLDKIYNKLGSSRFNNYLKQAMSLKLNGQDKGKDILLAHLSATSPIRTMIQQERPWVDKVSISKKVSVGVPKL